MRKHIHWKVPFKAKLYRLWDNTLKSIHVLYKPLWFAVPVTLAWYLLIYRRDIHLSEKAEGIATAAWIPLFGIFYALLATVVISTVWDEYKRMRTAVKRYDVDEFVDLRDENMSPLVHVLMGSLSIAVLGSFMALKYPDVLSGVSFIGSTAYLFGLILVVVREIDDPCTGVWFIKSIPAEWLEINVKEWRASRCEKPHREFLEHLKEHKRCRLIKRA